MRSLPWIMLIVGAVVAWIGVWALIFTVDVGAQEDFFAPMRMLAYVIFVAAPLLTFLPIARALSAPLYDLEAVVAWSTLLFVVVFINPGDNPPLSIVLIFLVSLMMSIATVFTLVSYAVGYRLLTRRSQKYDFLRARREGYLAAMFLVGLLLLQLLDVLSFINGALLGLIIVLLEVFLLSRGTPSRLSTGQSQESGQEARAS